VSSTPPSEVTKAWCFSVVAKASKNFLGGLVPVVINYANNFQVLVLLNKL
jgi:hypothetical protein